MCGRSGRVDETGQESYITVEDEWLRENGLDVGSQWPEIEKSAYEIIKEYIKSRTITMVIIFMQLLE